VAEVLPILYLLMGFMIIGAIIAIEATDLLSTVICVGAIGFGLSVIDLFLGAPDLAITQVSVEVIVLVILIRVALKRDETSYEIRRGTFTVGAVMLFLGALLAICAFAFKQLVPFGSPLMSISQDYLNTGIEKTGAANFVMGIVLDLRAYDTLGEATVIFTSIIAAIVVLRKIGRKKREGNVPNR